MNAIILAGAPNSGSLRQVSSARYEAEIPIAGRPMLDYVVKTFCDFSRIDRIIVVGYPSTLSAELRPRVNFVEPGASGIESLIKGMENLPDDEPVLVTTADVPLLTIAALDDFLARCQERSGDLYYSFVSKTSSEAKYPGMKRTYAKVREGTFTGGNLVLLVPRFIRDNLPIILEANSCRKRPLHLAKMMGWSYIIRGICGNLRMVEVEERINQILHSKMVGIVTPFPEVGFDVDKPSDYYLVERILAAK